MLPFALWESHRGARCRLGSTSHGRCHLTVELAQGGSRRSSQSPGRGIGLDRIRGSVLVSTGRGQWSRRPVVLLIEVVERFVDLGGQPEVMQ